jgi:dynein heavy chain
MRRNVYVTPKSYLSFLGMYKEIYSQKYKLIDVDEQNINSGLERLAEASLGIDQLKISLKIEDAKLKEASEATDKLLKELDIETKKADTKAREVALVTEGCMLQKSTIAQERSDA